MLEFISNLVFAFKLLIYLHFLWYALRKERHIRKALLHRRYLNRVNDPNYPEYWEQQKRIERMMKMREERAERVRQARENSTKKHGDLVTLESKHGFNLNATVINLEQLKNEGKTLTEFIKEHKHK